eukprot:1153835-Pelagomonas_calceolata.AAC.8
MGLLARKTELESTYQSKRIKGSFSRTLPPHNVSNDPILNARHAVMPGIRKCENFPLEKKEIPTAPHKPAIDIIAPVPFQFNPNLQLKVASCQIQAQGKAVLGAGVYYPMNDQTNLV